MILKSKSPSSQALEGTLVAEMTSPTLHPNGMIAKKMGHSKKLYKMQCYRMEAGSPAEAAAFSALVLRNFVASFIEYPKVLVAAVNGPAVGISSTFLPLFDAVYLSEEATIRTPFASTAQAPEGCSSFTFPQIMGRALANQVLLFDKRLSAQEAKDCGLATQVLPHKNFHELIIEKVEQELAIFHPKVWHLAHVQLKQCQQRAVIFQKCQQTAVNLLEHI